MNVLAESGESSVLVDVFASEAAFEVWYERVLPRVFGYIFARCGRDPDLAEELTQQTFVDAVRHRATFAGRSDPVTWLCAIARHKIADHYRRLEDEERRRSRLVVRETPTALGEQWLRADERDSIQRALASLPALQRAVLVFTALDGLSVRETAALIGKSEGATESLLGRARLAFREAYGRDRGSGDG